MKIYRKYFVQFKVYLMLMSAVLLSTLPTASVFATSDYDDAIQTGGSYALSFNQTDTSVGGYCPTVAPLNEDFTGRWSEYLSDRNNYVPNETYRDTGVNYWQSALVNENAAWSVSQTSAIELNNHVYYQTNGEQQAVGDKALKIVVSSSSRGASFSTDSYGNKQLLPDDTTSRTYFIAYYTYTKNGVYGCYPTVFHQPGGIIAQSSSIYKEKILTANYNVSYPSGYEGADLLTATTDSDGDGLSDFIESSLNPNRDAIFCDTSTPKNCAYPNPLQKDIYVEVDWMEDGATSYKPKTSQLSAVVDGLEDNGYIVHIDAGQYGGGKKVLTNYIQYLPFAYNASSVGFFDLKNGNSNKGVAANFNPMRQGIWHYLISGYGYDEVQSSSGASYAGSGNVFLSLGRIEDNQVGFGYSDLDTAVAGTMIHELGHSLCLSDEQSYSYQSTNCRYSGVDASAGLNYDSVMNYDLQMFQNNLSYGNNAFGDHNDWDAIDNNGIADFSKWDVSEADFEPGLTIEEAQKAKQRGTLGVVKRGDKVYNLREHKVYDLRSKRVYDTNKNGTPLGLSLSQQNWRDRFISIIK